MARQMALHAVGAFAAMAAILVTLEIGTIANMAWCDRQRRRQAHG